MRKTMRKNARKKLTTSHELRHKSLPITFRFDFYPTFVEIKGICQFHSSLSTPAKGMRVSTVPSLL